MQSLSHASADYNRIEKAIRFIENNVSSQPRLIGHLPPNQCRCT